MCPAWCTKMFIVLFHLVASEATVATCIRCAAIMSCICSDGCCIHFLPLMHHLEEIV